MDLSISMNTCLVYAFWRKLQKGENYITDKELRYYIRQCETWDITGNTFCVFGNVEDVINQYPEYYEMEIWKDEYGKERRTYYIKDNCNINYLMKKYNVPHIYIQTILAKCYI